MVHYELVKVTIDTSGQMKVIINIVVHHHGDLESIVTDQGLSFTSKFWFLLCYVLELKKKHFTAFYLQIDEQTKRQNSTIEVYLIGFINWEQNNLAKLLLMAEFPYNNTKNVGINHIPFKLHCGYYPKIRFKKDVDSCLRSHSANKLVKELKELIEVCCQNRVHI